MISDLNYILRRTIESAYLLVPILLLTGVAAFFFAFGVIRSKEFKRPLLPLAVIEVILFLFMFRYLVRWIGIGSLTWGFWYEGGWEFYLPFTAMVGAFIGYLLGITFARRKA